MSGQETMTDSQMRACLDNPYMDEALDKGEIFFRDTWWFRNGQLWVKQARLETDESLVARLRSGRGGNICMLDEAADEIELLRRALEVMHQTVLEVAHAQEVGSLWFTKGSDVLYQQVAMHIRRGFDAYASCAPNQGAKS